MAKVISVKQLHLLVSLFSRWFSNLIPIWTYWCKVPLPISWIQILSFYEGLRTQKSGTLHTQRPPPADQTPPARGPGWAAAAAASNASHSDLGIKNGATLWLWLWLYNNNNNSNNSNNNNTNNNIMIRRRRKRRRRSRSSSRVGG